MVSAQIQNAIVSRANASQPAYVMVSIVFAWNATALKPSSAADVQQFVIVACRPFLIVYFVHFQHVYFLHTKLLE